jgi:uncharacterized phage protein (TIGR01671 family)
MREIKFRGWNEGTKQMIDLQSITPFATPLKGLFIPSLDNVAIMQYTGIKDANGKEIYEGDVLLDLFSKATWVVKFGQCKKYGYTGWFVEEVDEGREQTLNSDLDTDTNTAIEIRGNIYETRNLKVRTY